MCRTTRWLPAIAWLCGLALCAGCGGRPGIEPLRESSVVVAFGDSLTAGTGAQSSESYPARLSQALGCRVVNGGRPGEVMAEGLARLPAVLRQHEPDLVILCHGGNDMLRKRADTAIRRNLEAMIARAKEAGADVVLVGVPRPGLLLKIPSFYDEIADQYGIPFERDALRKILRTPSLKSDQIHPNAVGYRKLAEAVAQVIRRSERS